MGVWPESDRFEILLWQLGSSEDDEDLKVVRKYRDSQPKAVATLRRDFRSTVTYYLIEQQFPSWERRHLRFTSRLERFNRRLRRRTRAAGAYHSD